MSSVVLQRRRKKRYVYSHKNLARKGLFFFLPFFCFFFVFTIMPVAVSAFYSLTTFNLLEPPTFVGLTNYYNLFTADDVFLIAFKNTMILGILVGGAGYIMSFLFAFIIHEMKARMFFALGFYIPSMTTGVALSTVWGYIFSGDRYGLLNDVLITLNVIDDPILWTADTEYIFTVVVIVSLWMSVGTGFLVFLAGLSGVPEDIYEAGAIDGVRSKYQKLVHLTLPMMKPQLLFGVINTISSAFGAYEISAQIAGMPSVNYVAHTIGAHMTDKAFTQYEMGYASAVSVILFALTFSLGKLFMKLLSSKDE